MTESRRSEVNRISKLSTREWLVVSVQAPPLAAESVASLVTEVTRRGVTLNEQDHAAVITGYLQEPEAARVQSQLRIHLAELAANLGNDPTFPFTVTSMPEEEWLAQWRDSYLPVRVGRRLVVKPSWHCWPPPDGSLPALDDDIVIEIDPQMAFGTGHHPTTQLCLAALEDLVQPGCSVADVGCGSGILSIAAVKIGAAEVWAVDHDAVAVEIARENVAKNRVADYISLAVGDGLRGVEREFDVIVANISTPVIVALSSSLATHLAAGGAVTVAGIPTVRAPRVASALRQAGLWAEATRTMGAWVCLIARRRTNRRGVQPHQREEISTQ